MEDNQGEILSRTFVSKYASPAGAEQSQEFLGEYGG